MTEANVTIFDGHGRYAGRTRVNRLVWDFDVTAGQAIQEAIFELNGEIHNIWLDTSASALDANANADTDNGTFEILCGDYLTQAGGDILYCQPINELDFTSKGNVIYNFQTNEGAAQGTMEHSLSVMQGLSAHDTPAPPKITAAAGAAFINKNQPWTGRVCGKVKLRCTEAGRTFTGAAKIRVTIIYS